MRQALNLHGDNRTVHICGGRVVECPVPGAVEIDLSGHIIQPGRVNAHDHLELNHYPRTRFRTRYDNAHQWGRDVDEHLNQPPFQALRRYPIWDRCFIGGLKNLLSGVTTVAHHGPLYRPLKRRRFPVRVLRRCGWSHSLHFETPQQVQASYQNTAPDAPWFIHLAEGTDASAADEYRQLNALGCVGPNTVIVHGVGLTPAHIQDTASRIRGLVWCPSTNMYLLGKTCSADQWINAGGRIALGSDSRLTADGDLLDEMRAAGHPQQDEMVTRSAADILGLTDVGRLEPGARADCIISVNGTRGGVQLVMIDGAPQFGSPDIMDKFPHMRAVRATLDGEPKAVAPTLARLIQHCTLHEPGLELNGTTRRRFWLL